MSAVNVFLEQDRVRIITDSVAYRALDPVAWSEKAAPNDAGTFVTATRGSVRLGRAAKAFFGRCATFEAAIAAIPLFPTVAADELADCPLDRALEVTIAGIGADGQAQAVRVEIDRTGIKSATRCVPGGYLAPSLGAVPIPGGISDAKLFKLALAQQEHARKHGLRMVVGGEVVMHEVTAAGVVRRILGRFPDFDFTERRIAKNSSYGRQSLAEVAA